MPQRYFIWFAYNGARYHGWQVQPNGNSVQAELEKALATLLRMPVPTTGAGRTDAGVHASCMVAHFDLDRDIDCDQLAYKLNRLLPYDIAVSRIQPVQPDMHARFSAVARTYHYYIHTAKDPFCTFSSCRLHYQLDFDAMNRAAAILLQTADFASFCSGSRWHHTSGASSSRPTGSCAIWCGPSWAHSSMWAEAVSRSRSSGR